ncbi:hypothetical protein Pfo_018315 [Paulownia fortunei]|nr:hypothetical protein Pfo_018315 [Paulownia fortunei]
MQRPKKPKNREIIEMIVNTHHMVVGVQLKKTSRRLGKWNPPPVKMKSRRRLRKNLKYIDYGFGCFGCKQLGDVCVTNPVNPTRSRKNNAWWDLPTIVTLLELMYEQFKNGQFLSSIFSEQVWSDIAKEMYERTKIPYKGNSEEANLLKKGLLHYDMCTEIFASLVATGDIARSLHNGRVVEMGSKRNIGINFE